MSHADADQVLERTAVREKFEPPRAQVVLLNDDFTPMEFVIEILHDIFGHGPVEAERIMLEVHHQGSSVCGEYIQEIAEDRAERVHREAEHCEFPLRCLVRPLGSDPSPGRGSGPRM